MQPLIDAVLTKKCRVCSEEKTLSEFHPNKTCKLGVVGTCRKCSGERLANWYKSKRIERQTVANERNRRKKDQVVEHFGRVCFDCKQSYPNCVFQFHHLDPYKKDVNPSYAIANSSEKMWEELSKCVMLCANCHLIRHFGKEGVDATTH